MGIIGLNAIGLDGNVVIKRGVSGETINNQDKVVDITENGTTEVVADDGYTGLGKVTINTEVSGGGESGGSNYIYYDQKRTILNIRDLWKQASTVKIIFNGQTLILPAIDIVNTLEEDPSLEKAVVAVCIDPNIKICLDPTKPPRTWIEQNQETFEYVNEVRITEEEYFNLNA